MGLNKPLYGPFEANDAQGHAGYLHEHLCLPPPREKTLAIALRCNTLGAAHYAVPWAPPEQPR